MSFRMGNDGNDTAALPPDRSPNMAKQGFQRSEKSYTWTHQYYHDMSISYRERLNKPPGVSILNLTYTHQSHPILHQGGGARHHRKGDWTLGANPSAGDFQLRGVHVATQGRG